MKLGAVIIAPTRRRHKRMRLSRVNPMSKHYSKGIPNLRPPRVALLVCNLGQSGAEKQLVYIAQALASAGIEVRIYTLEEGGFYAAALRQAGIEIYCFGTVPFAPARLIALTAQL